MDYNEHKKQQNQDLHIRYSNVHCGQM